LFGTLRLALAMVVVLSHIGMNWRTFWPGIIAVAIFYMISGYAMTALIESGFRGKRASPRFYLERFVRLAPQYYAWLALTILVYAAVGWPSIGGRPIIPFDFFAYATVVPLGMQNYAWPINTLFVPVATTLAIEITFYVFSPWILRSRPLSYLAAAVSLLLIAAPAFHWSPGGVYTYYNTPGPMVFFIMGSFQRRKERAGLVVIAGLTLLLCAIGLPAFANLEYIIATIIGIPLLIVAEQVRTTRIDTEMGRASYGCFLGHVLVLFPVMKFVFGIESYPTIASRVIAAIGCAFVGYLSFLLIERPTIGYRRRLRSE
jgi:peptidoglycan/LPS O-acetylase OafA/YrhL